MKYLLIAILFMAIMIPDDAMSRIMRRGYPTTGTSTSQPPTWVDNANTRAVWYLEETTTTVRDNAETDAANDLSHSGSPTQNADAKQGSFSNEFATGQYLECTNANCGTDMNITGVHTTGCWIYADVSSNLRRILARGTSSTTANTTGYAITRTSGSELSCWTQNQNSDSTGNALPVSTWKHAVCAYSGTQLRPFIDGTAVGSLTTTTAPGTNTNPFRLASRSDATTANQQWDGLLDECFVIAANVAASSICRIARCGMAGEYCVCDGTTPANYKSCITDIDCKAYSDKGTCDTTAGTCRGRNLSCTPVACNDAGP
jgi:hypothetical protein